MSWFDLREPQEDNDPEAVLLRRIVELERQVVELERQVVELRREMDAVFMMAGRSRDE